MGFLSTVKRAFGIQANSRQKLQEELAKSADKVKNLSIRRRVEKDRGKKTQELDKAVQIGTDYISFIRTMLKQEDYSDMLPSYNILREKWEEALSNV